MNEVDSLTPITNESEYIILPVQELKIDVETVKDEEERIISIIETIKETFKNLAAADIACLRLLKTPPSGMETIFFIIMILIGNEHPTWALVLEELADYRTFNTKIRNIKIIDTEAIRSILAKAVVSLSIDTLPEYLEGYIKALASYIDCSIYFLKNSSPLDPNGALRNNIRSTYHVKDSSSSSSSSTPQSSPRGPKNSPVKLKPENNRSTGDPEVLSSWYLQSDPNEPDHSYTWHNQRGGPGSLMGSVQGPLKPLPSLARAGSDFQPRKEPVRTSPRAVSSTRDLQSPSIKTSFRADQSLSSPSSGSVKFPLPVTPVTGPGAPKLTSSSPRIPSLSNSNLDKSLSPLPTAVINPLVVDTVDISVPSSSSSSSSHTSSSSVALVSDPTVTTTVTEPIPSSPPNPPITVNNPNIPNNPVMPKTTATATEMNNSLSSVSQHHVMLRAQKIINSPIIRCKKQSISSSPPRPSSSNDPGIDMNVNPHDDRPAGSSPARPLQLSRSSQSHSHGSDLSTFPTPQRSLGQISPMRHLMHRLGSVSSVSSVHPRPAAVDTDDTFDIHTIPPSSISSQSSQPQHTNVPRIPDTPVITSEIENERERDRDRGGPSLPSLLVEVEENGIPVVPVIEMNNQKVTTELSTSPPPSLSSSAVSAVSAISISTAGDGDNTLITEGDEGGVPTSVTTGIKDIRMPIAVQRTLDRLKEEREMREKVSAEKRFALKTDEAPNHPITAAIAPRKVYMYIVTYILLHTLSLSLSFPFSL